MCACSEHFETLLTPAPPVAEEFPRIRVADVNFGVNNSAYVSPSHAHVHMCNSSHSRSPEPLALPVDVMLHAL